MSTLTPVISQPRSVEELCNAVSALQKTIEDTQKTLTKVFELIDKRLKPLESAVAALNTKHDLHAHHFRAGIVNYDWTTEPDYHKSDTPEFQKDERVTREKILGTPALKDAMQRFSDCNGLTTSAPLPTTTLLTKTSESPLKKLRVSTET